MNNDDNKNKFFNILSDVKKKILKKDKNELKEKDTIAVDNINVAEGSVKSDTFTKTDLSENDLMAQKAAQDEISNRKKKKVALIRRILIILGIIIVFIIIVNLIVNSKIKSQQQAEIMKNTTKVRKMNLTSEITGEGMLSPKDKYTITSLVEGDIVEVNFDMGDKVEKDQILLVIDPSSAERNVINASTSFAQANENYLIAKYNYEKMEKDYKNNTYKAQFTGYLKSLKVKAGDKINSGTEIGTIVNDRIMTIKVPFIATEASNIRQGMQAVLTIQETGEYLYGIVKSVSDSPEMINNGAVVKYVTINTENPGGLSTKNTATALIKDYMSVEDANFEEDTNQVIKFEDGSNIEIEKLIVKEGTYVKKGDPIFKITDDTIKLVISSKKNAYLQAKESLTKSENNYDDAVDLLNEYYIKAPISGTVISKDAKVGDKIQKSTSQAKTLAMIYDLSELTFDMNVDELDITKVKLGQEVDVTADAFTNKNFKGEITKISMVSETSNGVSNYPVTITIKNIDKLLPGMNVDGNIILEKAEDALCIPSDALQRGNVVFVSNTSKTITEKKYNDDNISDRIKNRSPNGFTAVNVVTGISNDSFIQITEGLLEDDDVYVNESNNSNQFGGMNRMGGGMPGGMRGGGGMNRGR